MPDRCLPFLLRLAAAAIADTADVLTGGALTRRTTTRPAPAKPTLSDYDPHTDYGPAWLATAPSAQEDA